MGGRYILIPMLLLGSAGIGMAQPRDAWGVVGNVGVNSHSADFRAFPGVPNCCPSFNGGSGTGINLGVLYETPLGESLWGSMRLGYSTTGGRLLRTENTTVSGNEPGVFEHSIDASLGSLGIEPLISYSLLGSLRAHAGGRLGVLLQSQFSQRERLTSPSTGTFPNGRRSQNEVNGAEIPQSQSLQAAGLVGISYDLPMNANHTLLLSPEVFYSIPLTNTVSGLDWKVAQLRIGAALKWSPIYKEELFEKRYEVDTVSVERDGGIAGVISGVEGLKEEREEYSDRIIITTVVSRVDTLISIRENIVPSITAKAVYADGNTGDIFTVQTKEATSIKTVPLLPYIFFEEGKSTLDGRYRVETAAQVASKVEQDYYYSDKLETYHRILNIIAVRMRKSPQAKIVLTGCNADVGVEKSNTDLSRARAEGVKSVLVNSLGIDAKRIDIKVRNLPLKPSINQTSLGSEENRRVEISSADLGITSPLVISDTVRSTSVPLLSVYPDIYSSGGVGLWNMDISNGSILLASYSGTSEAPTHQSVTIPDSVALRLGPTISVVLKAVGNSGKEYSAQAQVPVLNTISRVKTQDGKEREQYKFSLILFDVASSEISAANSAIINEVKKYIKPTSLVTVVGYTDRLGDSEQNRTLAEQRAISTAKALGLRVDPARVYGQGNVDLLDSTTPEGRLYNRTVEITIENDIIP